MVERTIDLRKKSFVRVPESAPQTSPVLPDEAYESIHWSALEHEDRERSPYWFLGPGIVALLFVIFGVFAHSYFFIAFVVLAYGVLLVYAHRPPRRIEFRVGSDGVSVGSTLHPYSELKSFWIFDSPNHRELSVETARLLMPYLRIPLGDINPDRVGHAIARFLPEEEHKELISDTIARSLGF